MKSAKSLLINLAMAAAALLLIGCSGTVRPHSVKDRTPSFDGDAQTSGFIGFNAAGEGIITRHAADRYNALVHIYGYDFAPPVQAGEGLKPLSDGTFTIDRQHLVCFETMNRWFKSGKHPNQ